MGKKIYSTKKEKPRLGYALIAMMLVLVFTLAMCTSFLPQSTAGKQKASLVKQKAETKAKWKREYEAELKGWRALNHLVPMELGAKLAKAGAAPKTEAEAKEKSFTINSEAAKQVEAQTAPVEAAQAVAGGTHDYSMEELEQRKWAYILSQLEELKAKDMEAARHGIQVALIDGYLQGTPMAGLGESMVSNAERTGVKCYLCCVQAEAESSKGLALCGSYNAYGMLGCSFGSWEEGIQRFNDNIVAHWGPAQSAYELAGYCVPDHPYMENVQSVVDWFNVQEKAALDAAWAAKYAPK